MTRPVIFIGLLVSGLCFILAFGHALGAVDPRAEVRPISTVTPCTTVAELAERLALVALIEVRGDDNIQDFVDAVWQIRVAGRPPRADGVIIARFAGGMIGVYPFRRGVSCAALLVSPGAWERALALMRGDPA